jgi:hypothetical protein
MEQAASEYLLRVSMLDYRCVLLNSHLRQRRSLPLEAGTML